MLHRQSALNALDESQPNPTREAGFMSGHWPVHSGSKSSCLVSVRVCQRDWGPPVCDWWHGGGGSAYFWSRRRSLALLAGSCLCFNYFYFILIISMTNPAVECMHACVCTRTQGGFFHALSCTGMCNEILSFVLKTIGVPAIFTFTVFLSASFFSLSFSPTRTPMEQSSRGCCLLNLQHFQKVK